MMPRRTAIAVLVLTASTLVSACGTRTQNAAAPAAVPAYSAALHAMLPVDVKSSGSLRVGTDASYAPASSFAADGRTIVGFEPDLAAELGRVLGVRLTMVNHSFSTLAGDINNRRLDLAMSAMTDTAERERKVDFVDYFSAGTSIVVQRGNRAGISDLKDLCGQVVAVEEATTQQDLVRRTQKQCGDDPIELRVFPNNAEAMLQLRTGRAVAVLNDFPPAAYLTKQPSTRAHFQLASTAQYEPGLYGIAVAKDRTGLRDALRGALDVLIRRGTYQDVLARWSVTDGAVDIASVNGS